MKSHEKDQFSGMVTSFQEKQLREPVRLAGYSALIEQFHLSVVAPRRLFAIGSRHRVVDQDGWRFLTPRHEPDRTTVGHLVFALKYEGVDLAILKRLFLATGPQPIEEFVRSQPTGTYARRLWFLYEWLTGQMLGLPAATSGKYVPALDPALQYDKIGQISSRHRVRDNLPGSPAFCPLVFRTPALESFITFGLAERAREAIARVPKDILARTAAFLLLKDSRSSYAIEGEQPPQDRVQRWGYAIGEAGRYPLNVEELLRLQRLVVGNARFVQLGWRNEGGFVGEHDRDTGLPLPDHISARPQDLPALVDGLIAFANGPAQDLDPVVAAAILAFGFVYVHPFADGNGRLHRYLVHHILAQRSFSPPGIVFPVSFAMLEEIATYRQILESYSRRLLPLVEWHVTPGRNIDVSNDTADFYRFFDATLHAEFLFRCVHRTIEIDLPNEAAFLQRYDRFRLGVQTIADMPERTVDLLYRFLRQNDGRFSGRAREREFAALTPDEVEKIEAFYRQSFGGQTTPE